MSLHLLLNTNSDLSYKSAIFNSNFDWYGVDGFSINQQFLPTTCPTAKNHNQNNHRPTFVTMIMRWIEKTWKCESVRKWFTCLRFNQKVFFSNYKLLGNLDTHVTQTTHCCSGEARAAENPLVLKSVWSGLKSFPARWRCAIISFNQRRALRLIWSLQKHQKWQKVRQSV